MKQFIRHRANRAQDLSDVDPAWGVEIDLRSDVDAPGGLHLSHDAWKRGEDFDGWLDAFVTRGLRGPLILNTKEDGLEEQTVAKLAARELKSFFFLDTTVPTLVRWTAQGERRFATRCSKYEPAEACLAFADRCDWLWVDCFQGVPLTAQDLAPVTGKFRLCLVSPELQGQPLTSISQFAELYRLADAVCTKSPRTWLELFGS
ncbi:MAG: hypothetical protein ACT4TC_00015 [Myxococcaceae bacterium]